MEYPHVDLPVDIIAWDNVDKEILNLYKQSCRLKACIFALCLEGNFTVSINLIDSINPFQRAYEILSKSLTPEVLHTIQYEIESQREEMTREEAIVLFTKYLPKWREEHDNKVPTLNEADANGRRIAMAIEYLRKLKQQSLAKKQ